MTIQTAQGKDMDRVLDAWSRKIPPSAIARPLSRTQVADFFQTSHRLIQLRDAPTTHRVITELASEGGLTRVAELVKLFELSLTPTEKNDILLTTLMPFLEVITHKDVLYSMMLEQVVANAYVFLHGIAGRRATALFSFLAEALQEELNIGPTNGMYSRTLTVLAALLRVLECNQSASLLGTFHHVVDTLQACLDALSDTFQGTLMEQAASHQMAKVRRHLEYEICLENTQSIESAVPNVAAAFEMVQDGPGTLSTAGPRHDNDHSQIQDIKILPTSDEIYALRNEYLPTKDSSTWHHPGIKGLLDQQFRLLREDTVGQLRDCVRTVMESLKPLATKDLTDVDHEFGLRFYKYDKVVLSNVNFDKRAHLRVMAHFQQPEHLSKLSVANRRLWWDRCKQLQIDALVCLVDSEGQCLFFSVCNQKGFGQAGSGITTGSFGNDSNSHGQGHGMKVPNLWQNPQRGTVTLRLIDMGNQDFKRMLGRDLRTSNVEQVLVEFPRVLLPSFQPTLEALQRMSRHDDLPFSEMLLPNQIPGSVQASWPAYASQPRFAFDLSPILVKGEPLYLQRDKAFDFRSLKERSTLDNAQCKALVGALSRNLALVQGPPGTGKSYIAVQAVKVLLACREKAEMNPIICVCYTNHALDQFLEHLIEGGTTQIVRIGSRSSSTILKPFKLREISAQMVRTQTEKAQMYKFRAKLEKDGNHVVDLFHQLKNAGTLGGILQFLEAENSNHHDQLKGTKDEDGFQTIQHQRGDRLKQWLEAPNAPLYQGQQPRSLEELEDAELRHMSNRERALLYDQWVSNSRQNLESELGHTIKRYVKTQANLLKCTQEVDLRCLERAHVIGVTTSGLARHVDLLRRLKPKVLICEEAGEILEAHTLTAFLPSIEHAILIGDHEQLRPGVQNYDLSVENPRGERYSLDVSTFERLIRDPDLEIPHDTLQSQRRMNPSISDLIRQTLYPSLKDHESVLDYPAVTGVRSRLYWLDHRVPETGDDPIQVLKTSHSNMYEVDLIQALAIHFVRQGVYGSNEIVILTPYVRQLLMLRDMLSSTFEIVMGDRDSDEVAKEGLDSSDTGPIVPHKTMLKQRIRISTVDNFQGEESNIVIISLVRSNTEKRCGFLRTTNRINVLLSRAKHGMYIIGNSETYKHIPMWAKVIRLLKAAGNIGPSLPLCCPQHPDVSIEVSTPEGFLREAPEGGCTLQCGLEFDCGHLCTYKCHSMARHQSVICREPCQRLLRECGHLCTRPCGVDCGDCLSLVENVPLDCGHIAIGVPCHQMSNLCSVGCQSYIEVVLPRCGHKNLVKCGLEISNKDVKCKVECGADLECGHQCHKPCSACLPRGLETQKHGSCNAPCGRMRSTCAHRCVANCHGDSPCPPCGSSCSQSCCHSTCTKRCSEQCAPCQQLCTAGCCHQGYCGMSCAAPCDILPCSFRCEENLACGHQCPSLCGELCPSTEYCQQCASTAVQQTIVDSGSLIPIGSLTYRESNLDANPVIVPVCGHITLMKTMDQHIGLRDHYELSSSGAPVAFRSDLFHLAIPKVNGCPQCQGSLRDLQRYNRLVKLRTYDERCKRLIVRSNNSLAPLINSLYEEEKRLTVIGPTMSGSTIGVKPTTLVRLGGPRGVLLHNISELSGLESSCGLILGLHERILALFARVGEDEQSFAKVQRMMANSSRALHEAAEIQMTGSLLTKALLLRCEFNILSRIVGMHGEQVPRMGTQHHWLKLKLCLDFSLIRLDCGDLIIKAIQQRHRIIEIEGRLLFARFVALENIASIRPGTIKELLPKARRQTEIAKRIVQEYSKLRDTNGLNLGFDDQNLEKELQKYHIMEAEPNVRCQVQDCAELLGGSALWRKHVEKNHSQWYETIKAGVSIGASNMFGEVSQVESMLQHGTISTIVTSAEKQAVYLAMVSNLDGAEPWYYCVNMHAFMKGVYEGGVGTLRCPHCGEVVAGPPEQASEASNPSKTEQQPEKMAQSSQFDLLEMEM